MPGGVKSDTSGTRASGEGLEQAERILLFDMSFLPPGSRFFLKSMKHFTSVCRHILPRAQASVYVSPFHSMPELGVETMF
jgi:hypothetical protein